MKYNLSVYEIGLRYVIMATLVISGLLMGSVWIAVLGIPVFLTAILGACPIYAALGIDHSSRE